MNLSEGVVAIEQTQLDALQAKIRELQTRDAQHRDDGREQLVASAVADVRIPPARRNHWIAALKADPEGTEAVLAQLLRDLVPLTELGNASADSEATDDDALLEAIFGTGAARRM